MAEAAQGRAPEAASPARRRREPNGRSPSPNPEFGEVLAALRRSRRLAQRGLAAKAGIDASTVSRLESGGRGVSREVVDRLARALAATTEEHNELLKTAGCLPEEAVALLDEPELARFSALLGDPTLAPEDRDTLLAYLRLALGHAAALGYEIGELRGVRRRGDAGLQSPRGHPR